MKVPSPILSTLVHHSGSFAEQEKPGLIEVPPTALPVLNLPVTIRREIQDASTPKDNSFVVDFNVVVTNGGPSNVIIAVVKPGLWEISLTAAYVSNYFGAGDGASIALGFDNAAAAVTDLMIFFANLNGNLTNAQKWVFSFDRLAFFWALVNPNAVGQTHSIALSLHCNRML